MLYKYNYIKFSNKESAAIDKIVDSSRGTNNGGIEANSYI